jgi:hypothetical protein
MSLAPPMLDGFRCMSCEPVHSKTARCLSSCGAYLVSGGYDRRIVVTRLRASSLVPETVSATTLSSEVMAVAILHAGTDESPEEAVIVAGCRNGQLYCLPLLSDGTEYLALPHSPSQSVSVIATLAGTPVFAVGSWDGSLRVFSPQVSTPNPVAGSFPASSLCSAIATCPKPNLVMVGQAGVLAAVFIPPRFSALFGTGHHLLASCAGCVLHSPLLSAPPAPADPTCIFSAKDNEPIRAVLLPAAQLDPPHFAVTLVGNNGSVTRISPRPAAPIDATWRSASLPGTGALNLGGMSLHLPPHALSPSAPAATVAVVVGEALSALLYPTDLPIKHTRISPSCLALPSPAWAAAPVQVPPPPDCPPQTPAMVVAFATEDGRISVFLRDEAMAPHCPEYIGALSARQIPSAAFSGVHGASVPPNMILSSLPDPCSQAHGTVLPVRPPSTLAGTAVAQAFLRTGNNVLEPPGWLLGGFVPAAATAKGHQIGADGRVYDHVFAIESEAGSKAQICLNATDNPYLVADAFLADCVAKGLPGFESTPAYRDQIVDFIRQNTGGQQIGGGPSSSVALPGVATALSAASISFKSQHFPLKSTHLLPSTTNFGLIESKAAEAQALHGGPADLQLAGAAASALAIWPVDAWLPALSALKNAVLTAGDTVLPEDLLCYAMSITKALQAAEIPRRSLLGAAVAFCSLLQVLYATQAEMPLEPLTAIVSAAVTAEAPPVFTRAACKALAAASCTAADSNRHLAQLAALCTHVASTVSDEQALYTAWRSLGTCLSRLGFLPPELPASAVSAADDRLRGWPDTAPLRCAASDVSALVQVLAITLG